MIELALAAALQAAPESASPPAAAGIERFLGSWSCTSAAGSHGRQIFTRVDATTVRVENHVTFADGTTTWIVERYARNPQSGGFHVTTSVGAFRGDGPAWTDPSALWSADGYVYGGNVPRRARVTYAPRPDGTFARSWNTLRGGVARPYSSEVCVRDGTS